jgi:hypothetical protein
VVVLVQGLLAHPEDIENLHVLALGRLLITEADECILHLLTDLPFEAFRDDVPRGLAGTEAGKPRLPCVVAGDPLTLLLHIGSRNLNAEDGAAVWLGFERDVHDRSEGA